MAESLERLAVALADHYTIEREIGRGGMATVFLAEDLKHQRNVALKVFSPELAAAVGPERFLQEIKIAANLHHPHILPLYDSGEADGFLYYVMPFVEGESLRDRLLREKQLAIDDALQIAREVADALSYAHSHGVIHRDIKPENILLESGHAVVADFGIARAIDAAGGQRLTQTGFAVGTPPYMSPEQAAGERDLDGRSDLYSLGCVTYEMLAGKPPFTGPTVESLVHQHLTAEPPNVTAIRPSVPGWVAAALERSLAKTPADRFNPVALFGEAIAPRVSVTDPSVRAAPGRRRRLLVPALIGAAALVAILVVLVRMMASRPLTITVSNITRVTSDVGVDFQPALSPTGADIAYVTGAFYDRHVVVRSAIEGVAGGETRIDEGTTGIRWFPSWMPDGASLRFLACPAEGPCTWKEAGTRGGSVRSVGVPRPSTVYAWSRDGSRAAFVVADSIFEYTPGAGEPRLLGVQPGEMSKTHSLTWSPDGQWIAYVHGNPEWRFGANQANASIWILDSRGGEPVAVTDGEHMDVSPAWLDDEHLLFVSDRGGQREVFAIAVDPTGSRREPRRVPGPADPHSISISAGGKKLAYARFTVSQNIWSIPIPQSGPVSIREAVPVTTGNQTVEFHDLSPDGEWLVFDSDLRGRLDLYKTRLGDEGQEPVADIRGDEASPVWSPDGGEIAYYGVESGRVAVFTVAADGGMPELIVDFPGLDLYPAWSPDGRSLAFVSQGPAGTGPRKVWTVSRDSVGTPWGEPELLTDSECHHPRWAPDGETLLCRQPTPTGGFLRLSRDGETVARYDPAAVGLQEMWIPEFSPDGSRIYANGLGENSSRGVWWLPSAGGRAVQVVTFDDPTLRPTSMLTVSRRYLYITVGEFESDIYVMDLEW